MNLTYDLSQLKRPILSEGDQRICGDATLLIENDQFLFAALFDGAGHGLSAYTVAEKAMSILKQSANQYPVYRHMYVLHEALRGSIGGVALLCQLEKSTGFCECTGIGNIGMRLFATKSKHFMIRGGILGDEIANPIVHNIQLMPGNVLILYSDGICDHFIAENILGFKEQEAKNIARILIEHYSKMDDDASVIVIKVNHD